MLLTLTLTLTRYRYRYRCRRPRQLALALLQLHRARGNGGMFSYCDQPPRMSSTCEFDALCCNCIVTANKLEDDMRALTGIRIRTRARAQLFLPPVYTYATCRLFVISGVTVNNDLTAFGDCAVLVEAEPAPQTFRLITSPCFLLNFKMRLRRGRMFFRY